MNKAFVNGVDKNIDIMTSFDLDDYRISVAVKDKRINYKFISRYNIDDLLPPASSMYEEIVKDVVAKYVHYVLDVNAVNKLPNGQLYIKDLRSKKDILKDDALTEEEYNRKLIDIVRRNYEEANNGK